MKSSEFDSKIARLASLSECSDRELHDIQWLFENNEAFARKVIDEKTMDALIQLESQATHERESFIDTCTTKVWQSIDDNSQSNPTVTPSSNAIQIQASLNWPQRHKSQHIPKLPLAIGISVAATLLILLGTALWTVNFGNPQLSLKVDEKSVSTQQPKTIGQERQTVSPTPSSQKLGQTSDPMKLEKPEKPKSGPPEAPKRPLVPRPNEPLKTQLGSSLGSNLQGPTTTPKPDGSKSKPKTEVAATYANWASGTKRDDPTASTNRRIGDGPFSTDDTSGRLVMDNGAVLFFEGPFSGELVSDASLIVNRGNVHLTTPRSKDASFQLTTPDSNWDIKSDSALQLNVNELGQEGFVFEGQVDLRRHGLPESEETISLTPKGLQQVLIENSNHQTAPTILAARGKRAFLGQVGFPDTKDQQPKPNHRGVWQTDSPKYFSRLINQITQRENLALDPNFTEQWQNFIEQSRELDVNQLNAHPQFEQMMQQLFDRKFPELPNQKLRDAPLAGATQFQGSININGKEQKFNSFEDFRRAQKAANAQNQNVPPLAQPGSAQAFQGEINLNGRSFKFSTPQQFNAMRRRARR